MRYALLGGGLIVGGARRTVPRLFPVGRSARMPMGGKPSTDRAFVGETGFNLRPPGPQPESAGFRRVEIAHLQDFRVRWIRYDLVKMVHEQYMAADRPASDRRFRRDRSTSLRDRNAAGGRTLVDRLLVRARRSARSAQGRARSDRGSRRRADEGPGRDGAAAAARVDAPRAAPERQRVTMEQAGASSASGSS